MISDSIIEWIIAGIAVLILFTGACVLIVYAEEVSCQYLDSNDLGIYYVSKIPGGGYELRPDYHTQRDQCIIDKQINNVVIKEDTWSWLNW